jgi:hypothetical protein
MPDLTVGSGIIEGFFYVPDPLFFLSCKLFRNETYMSTALTKKDESNFMHVPSDQPSLKSELSEANYLNKLFSNHLKTNSYDISVGCSRILGHSDVYLNMEKLHG